MSAAVVIAIGIAVVVVLGAIAFVTAAKRSDIRGAGALSRETRRRDKDAEIDGPVAAARRTGHRPRGRARRRHEPLHRSRHGRRHGAGGVGPAGPGGARCQPPQFFNRATVSLVGASTLTFAAASFVASCGRFAVSGFGGKVRVGNRDEIIDSIRTNGGFFYSSRPARGARSTRPGVSPRLGRCTRRR
jgi:cytochrome b6-f complex iron-sulfur subunit